jgi:hypothetical protein
MKTTCGTYLTTDAALTSQTPWNSSKAAVENLHSRFMSGALSLCVMMYTLSNKIQAAWNFLKSSEPEVTCLPVAIMIRVVLLFPIFVHSWRFSVFHILHSVTPPKTPVPLINLKLKHEFKFVNFPRHALASSTARRACCEGVLFAAAGGSRAR